jgi:dienelactone hydrolase
MADALLHETDQPAGAPLVPPVDASAVETNRRQTHASYEAFLRRHLEQLDRERPNRWQRDYSSPDAYERSVAPMRARLQRMLGFWVGPGQRGPLQVGTAERLYDAADFTATRFRLEILPGLETYAIELEPRQAGPRPGLIVQHGYGGTPESVCGFTPGANEADYSYRSLGIRAVRRGFHVMAVHHPSGHGSSADGQTGLPDFAYLGPNYGKNRLHRLASMGYGTLFGLDMMGSSRGLDLLLSRPGVDADRIGMYGLSQGGESALFLPALDPRIHASVCSAYFNHRFVKLVGPHRARTFLDSAEEDKFFAEVIPCFSDCDVVSLIAPRAFAVEAGQKDSSVDFEKAEVEFARAREHYERLGLADRIEFIGHAEGHVSATRRAFAFLTQHLRGAG